MDVKGHVLFLKGEGTRSWGKTKAGRRGVPTSQPRELGPAPHLLLEQGLESILPVPDALAQLCLLDKLLRGGDEELLGGTRELPPSVQGPLTQQPASSHSDLPHSFGPAPHSSGMLAWPLPLEKRQL